MRIRGQEWNTALFPDWGRPLATSCLLNFTKEIAKLNQTATQCQHIVHKDILQWAIMVSTNSYIKSSSAKVNRENTCVS